MHKPIQFENLSLYFPHKTCFENFTGQIFFGSRIAIIGNNGTGKSTLLRLLAGLIPPSDGEIVRPDNLKMGYIPQVIDAFDSLSGGQRFNKVLTEILAPNPSLLLLDEPSNHLDANNRKSLIRLLRGFTGTLIMVTHDIELLQSLPENIWHLDNGQIHVFSGNYNDYWRESGLQRMAIEDELATLKRQKQKMHLDLMKEQRRAKGSKLRGQKHIQQNKWPTIVSHSKAGRAEQTSGRKKSAIAVKKEELNERLSGIQVIESIKPQFTFSSQENKQTLVTIRDGRIGYSQNNPILRDLSLSIHAKDRITIQGNNGSGKSTLIKAIIGDEKLIKEGDWVIPNKKDIGYLDQHYATLSPDKTVLETIMCLSKDKPYTEIRRHLNDFLFRKNEEVNALVSTLSGGEKARLSLAQIAANTPRLLILDELTNNLDLQTREHVIQVLKNYPGALILISHDTEFLRAVDVVDWYQLEEGLLSIS